MNTILKVESIEKYYGNKNNLTKAIDNLSFEVPEGQFISIMGASGSGKTTLLNCISTIDSVSAGHIYLGGQNLTEISETGIARFRRENLGFIFQDFNLLDTLSVEENIALALTINGGKPRDIAERTERIAKRLGITDILNKFPYQISGGQKQRCACARAVVNEPRLVLADEPTGALDSKSAGQLLEVMNDMNQNLKATILMVTHDPFSASYAERILFLKDGKIFNEIYRGGRNRSQFYHEILDVLTVLGGDLRC